MMKWREREVFFFALVGVFVSSIVFSNMALLNSLAPIQQFALTTAFYYFLIYMLMWLSDKKTKHQFFNLHRAAQSLAIYLVFQGIIILSPPYLISTTGQIATFDVAGGEPEVLLAHTYLALGVPTELLWFVSYPFTGVMLTAIGLFMMKSAKLLNGGSKQ